MQMKGLWNTWLLSIVEVPVKSGNTDNTFLKIEAVADKFVYIYLPFCPDVVETLCMIV